MGPVNDQLLSVLPEHDQVLGKVLPACAIIGSSGHMLKYEKGAEIDAHDLVFRFNSAPTKGYAIEEEPYATRAARVRAKVRVRVGLGLGEP